MDRRTYYFMNLNPDDFKFVTKAEYDLCKKVEIEKEEKILYTPLPCEIEEWLQAVEALNSSRPVKRNGRLFGDLDPVPLIDEVDPAPNSCFNCWSAAHQSVECPAPRVLFCINCGRREERVVDCPRCSRRQLDFFARRRDEARRRAAAPRSLSVDGRQVRKVPEVSGFGAEGEEANRGVRKEATSRRDYSQSESVRTEKPKVPCNSGPEEYRGAGDETAVVAANKRTRRRRQRRRRQAKPQGASTTGEEKREDGIPSREALEPRPVQQAVLLADATGEERTEARDRRFRSAERSQRPTSGAAGGEGNRVVQCARPDEPEVSRRGISDYRVDSFYEHAKPKIRFAEENVPVSLDSGVFLNFLEKIDYLGDRFCDLMKSMKLSRAEIDQTLEVLKVIQPFNLITQQQIIVDELLFEIPEPKWWIAWGRYFSRTKRKYGRKLY